MTLPNPASPQLVVTVPTYNGRHLLEVVLPSLAAQRFRDFRVVVVDDASTDGTVDWLRSEWPDVETVALRQNVGVTAAFNVCLDSARGAEFVGLFNNDVELDPDCLGELVEALREHPEAGSAGAKLVDYHHRALLDGAGDVLNWSGQANRRGHGEPNDGRYSEPEDVFGACGGAAVYRAAALASVGRFDERFEAFSEDIDWALRAQLAGWSCRYVPSAIAFHMGSATLGKGLTDFTAYHLWRNAIWMIAKDYPAAAIVRHAPAIARGLAVNLAAAWWDGKLDVWRRAVRDALAGLPGVLRSRREVQRRRKRGLRQLERVMGR